MQRGVSGSAIVRMVGLALAVGLAPIAVSSARAEFGTPKERTATREITGDLVAKTGVSLSLGTGRNSETGIIEEALIPVNPKTVKLERIKSLTELQRGDKIRVECKLTYREDDAGEERLAGMTATKVTWLSRGVAQTGGLRSATEAAQ